MTRVALVPGMLGKPDTCPSASNWHVNPCRRHAADQIREMSDTSMWRENQPLSSFINECKHRRKSRGAILYAIAPTAARRLSLIKRHVAS